MSDETKPNLPSTTEDAANTTLDVVTDVALDATIPAPIRRNMFKAFDRLCSALIDVPVGALERRSAEKRAESEARIKIIGENADQIAKQMKVDPEYAQIAVSKYGQKILREQVSLDNISAIAANEFRKDKPNNSANQDTSEPNEGQSVDATNQESNGSAEQAIDDVWLNIFETEARPQSTEEGQLLFGRILAGEIRQPGSYSIRTIKTLGELDQRTAILFKKLCSLSTGHINLSSGDISTFRVLTLENNLLSSHTLERHGLSYNALSTLQEYGLVLDSDFSHWHFEKLPILFRHQGQNWMISSTVNRDENQHLDLFGIQLSQTAHELYSLVDQESMPEYTEDLKKLLAGLNLSVAEVDIISIEKNKGIRVKAKRKHD